MVKGRILHAMPVLPERMAVGLLQVFSRPKLQEPHGPSAHMEPFTGKVETNDGEGRRFERHAFICISDSACNKDGPAVDMHAALKAKLRATPGLKETLRVNKSGCLGQCGHGPMMVVYPEGVWYAHLTQEEIGRVWEEHLLGGKPVEELRFRTEEAGTNVLPMASTEHRIPATASPHYHPCSRCLE